MADINEFNDKSLSDDQINEVSGGGDIQLNNCGTRCILCGYLLDINGKCQNRSCPRYDKNGSIPHDLPDPLREMIL